MKDTILKGRTKIIVTFAAIALMGSGVLLAAIPVSADDGAQHPHSMRKHFGRHLTEQQRAEMHEELENLTPEERRAHREEARKHRAEAISGFLEISPEELRTRVENGESIKNIAQEEGKTRDDFKAYMMDYMKTHRLHDSN